MVVPPWVCNTQKVEHAIADLDTATSHVRGRRGETVIFLPTLRAGGFCISITPSYGKLPSASPVQNPSPTGHLGHLEVFLGHPDFIQSTLLCECYF